MISKRTIYLTIQAAVNAIVIGFVAKGLVFLIEAITQLSFYGRFSFHDASPAGNHLGIWVIGVPIAGSILVGLMARYGSKGIRGHGIPEAMEKIIMDESKIPAALMFLKPLSAALSIGTGGPFGAEGPIIATGGAFGSVVGQWAHISAEERKILLAAGACAGMAAIFGCPLAAVLLAVELLLFEFSARSIIPVTLSSIAGGAMHVALFGWQPVFAMPALAVPGSLDILLYTGIGLVVGVVACYVSKSVYYVEDLFERLPIHWMWWPALGAVFVGVIGYFAPRTMGVGYDNIRLLLTGAVPLIMLFSLCVLKYLSWVIALGSGTSGGTLAPLFTIGGALGGLIGMLALHWFPRAPLQLDVCVLVGMAAMFAGASRAFLTSVIFALETTGQFHGLLPLLGACSVAYLVSFFLMKGTIMTEKILRRGIQAPMAYEPDLLENTAVGAVLKEISGGAVPDKDGLYTQVEPQEGSPIVYTGDTLAHAVGIMEHEGLDRLIVVAGPQDPSIVGTISASAVLGYYALQKRRSGRLESPRRTMRWMARARRMREQLKGGRGPGGPHP